MEQNNEQTAKALKLLQQHWGYTHFRTLQKEIISQVLQKKDVLALMPTGGGKSICFQIPALMQPGITLVITPLIALMEDQVYQLKQRDIKAVAIHAGLTKEEVNHTLDLALYGKIKLLYLSPERLKSTSFLERLQHMKVSLLAIDEAHCISQWGYDFRPAYLAIADVKKFFPNVATIAVTATATQEVQQDIKKKLAMQHAIILKKSFARENLSYVVRQSTHKERTLLSILQKTSGSTIIYANTRIETEHLSHLLNKNNITADYYHAGLDTDTRTLKQQAWIKEAKRVMIATNAFGMGIDKPNVRFVLHTTPPNTLEAYYQEAGRAGRDGLMSYAILLYDEVDFNRLLKKVEESHLSPERLKALYQSLANHYQIAVGSHAGVTYEIDVEHFAITYGFSPSQVKTGMKQLEVAGLIQLNEQRQAAQVHIILSGNQLYAFQMTNPTDDILLKALIDFYDPFEILKNISLKRLAEACKKNVKQINKQLKSLAQMGVLKYKAEGKPSLLTFLTPRYTTDQLPLAKHEKRQDILRKKVKEVIDYTKHKHRCRSQILLEYFGEISYKTCGICDICLLKKRTEKDDHADYKKFCPLILDHLTQGKLPVHILIDKIDTNESIAISKVIQTMLEKNEVTYDDALHLCKVENRKKTT